jgi:hypothetical protein
VAVNTSGNSRLTKRNAPLPDLFSASQYLSLKIY